MKHLNYLVIIALLSFSLNNIIENSIDSPDISTPSNTVKPISLIQSISTQISDVQSFNLDISGGWQTIKNETFEGSWPSQGWTVVDLINDGYDRKWDDDNYKRHGGYNGVWPARGGVNGKDPIVGNDHYFNNMNTRMKYGPFDLSDAVKADISFWLWREFETCCDYLVLEVSTNNIIFNEISRWTSNNLNWVNISVSLDGYIGYSSIWVSWRFYSNNNVVYDGPWIDDILLRKYVPGQIRAYGTFSYNNRNNILVGSRYMNAKLYDADPGGTDDLLTVTTTNSYGSFEFPTLTNWDVDDNDPDPNNRRLDLYIVWEADFNDNGASRHRVVNFSNSTYNWTSYTWMNVPDGSIDSSSYLPPGWIGIEAMWIFQDIRSAWEYVYNATYPHIDPGSVTAKWELNANCYPSDPGICSSFFYGGVGGPFLFISNINRLSSDTVVHETGHNFMYNATGWWLWWDTGCYTHYLFSLEDINCAWSEGWADFLPLVANYDQCYDYGIGPCTGIPDQNYYNLETHGRGDQFPWGDIVEGRIAGALYDLYDNTNDGYDSSTSGFSPIADIIFYGTSEDSFLTFWDSWMEGRLNKHNAVRAIYQNTIDYDTAPVFIPPIPDVTVLENNPRYHAIDLWQYSSDNESLDAELTYLITYTSDWHCGISLDDHWIDILVEPNWLGTCDTTIRVSDSLITNNDYFRVSVVPVVGIAYLSLIIK